MNLKIWISFKRIKELAKDGIFNLSEFHYSFITDKQIKRWIGKVGKVKKQNIILILKVLNLFK
jgi:hypothetical protein